MKKTAVTKCGDIKFEWGKRTFIMGIINLSPDSFSGDGLENSVSAYSQARRMIAEGADILDVGGESTRPGFAPVTIEEEISRVVPVIKQLAREVAVPVSIDSYKFEVVSEALDAGALIINDQWGLKKDKRLAVLAAERNVPIILMGNQRDRGGFDPGIKRDTGYYDDVMNLVISDLRTSIATAEEAGLQPDNIIIDPGLGFGKTWKHDLEIIRRLDELKVLDKPILIGPSRKSFIKMILNLPADDRVEGTAAAVAISILKGADIVRVHDVKKISRICRVSDAIVRGTI